MANPAPPISATELLEHQAWIRRLARGLLRDEHAAEDAAQDALRAALERPPAERTNLRGWLGAVVRNAALQIKRSETARAARERSVARGEALPPPPSWSSRRSSCASWPGTWSSWPSRTARS